MTLPVSGEPEQTDEAQIRRNLLPALLELSDILDEQEGPVILAWAVPQLAAALARVLHGYGMTVAPVPVGDVQQEWGVRWFGGTSGPFTEAVARSIAASYPGGRVCQRVASPWVVADV